MSLYRADTLLNKFSLVILRPQLTVRQLAVPTAERLRLVQQLLDFDFIYDKTVYLGEVLPDFSILTLLVYVIL